MKKNFVWNICVGGCLAVFFVLSSVVVYAENTPIVESANTEDVKAIMEELNRMKQRISGLEKKVGEQGEVIERQRRVLEKVRGIPGIKQALAPPEPKFLVRKFVLNGAYLFTAKEFEPILDKYRGKKLGISDLEKIASKITSFYRDKGYITSLAYAPAQEIADNTVEFRIVEGRVGGIKVEDGKYYSKEMIERKFFVEEGQMLNYKKLEKSIKRINKQPDRTVKAVLLPGEKAGTSDILLKQEEEKSPRHLYVEYNNRGSEYTGEERVGIGFVDNNLFGYDDILSTKIRARADEDYDKVYGGSLDYNFPVSRYDTRLGFYGAYSHAEIGGQFKVLDPEGEATACGIYLTHPLFDKDFYTPVALNLTSNATLGFDSISVRNSILGEETSHDELRVIKPGIGFDAKDSMGRTFMSNELRIGIANFLGSMDEYDEDASRIDAGGEFIKYVGSLTRLSRLPFSSYLTASIKYQYTDSPLVNCEQFPLGGANTVRGFPENDYLADYGWVSTVELRTPAFLLPSGLRVPYDKEKTSLKDAMQFAYFIDFGEGHLKKAQVGEEDYKFLSSIGLGLRYDFADHLRGKIDWGFPIGDEESSDGSSSRVHFEVQYEF